MVTCTETTMATIASLHVHATQRFAVLEVGEGSASQKPSVSERREELPVVSLEDLLLHRQNGSTDEMQEVLKDALMKYGFCLLTAQHEKIITAIRRLRESLHTDLFPAHLTTKTTTNAASLQTSDSTYVSENGVPMYNLGYELCEDGVREVFRVAGGSPGTVEWPTEVTKITWMRGLGLMRHITDTALDLLLCHKNDDGQRRRKQRPHSGSFTWLRETPDDWKERSGDFSVLYAMHYFNTGTATSEVERGVAVKAHVDPSLLVIEPFLCPDTTGLQVWDRIHNLWIDCDGANSPIFRNSSVDNLLLLFCGKALSAAIPEIVPTRHRVVTGHRPRRTVIYEQKYQEFYPPPTFD